MIFKIAKWGHGAAIRLPANVMASMDWTIGDVISGRIEDGELTLKSGPKIPPEVATDLLALLTDAKERGKTTLAELISELDHEQSKRKQEDPNGDS